VLLPTDWWEQSLLEAGDVDLLWVGHSVTVARLTLNFRVDRERRRAHRPEYWRERYKDRTP